MKPSEPLCWNLASVIVKVHFISILYPSIASCKKKVGDVGERSLSTNITIMAAPCSNYNFSYAWIITNRRSTYYFHNTCCRIYPRLPRNPVWHHPAWKDSKSNTFISHLTLYCHEKKYMLFHIPKELVQSSRDSSICFNYFK